MILTIGPVRVIRSRTGHATEHETLLEAFVLAHRLIQEQIAHCIEADTVEGYTVECWRWPK